MLKNNMNKEDKEKYILELNKKAEFASGLEKLEKNKTFQELISRLKDKLEKGKNQLLKCEEKDISNARIFPRGIAMVLNQIEIYKKSGNQSKDKLKKLIKEDNK